MAIIVSSTLTAGLSRRQLALQPLGLEVGLADILQRVGHGGAEAAIIGRARGLCARHAVGPQPGTGHRLVEVEGLEFQFHDRVLDALTVVGPQRPRGANKRCFAGLLAPPRACRAANNALKLPVPRASTASGPPSAAWKPQSYPCQTTPSPPPPPPGSAPSWPPCPRVGVVALMAVLVVHGLHRRKRDGDYKVLFANLSEKDGAVVIAKLDQLGVDYKFAEGGGTILVPPARVYELRMKLSAAGVNKGSIAGYELLDGNTSFGQSDGQQRVQLKRALEGELTRTIQALASRCRRRA
jgi:hypothetical protein